MSKSPQSTTNKSSTNESETSTGFKQFWKKSGGNTTTQNVTFVSQDPTTKKSMREAPKNTSLGSLLTVLKSQIESADFYDTTA